MDKITLFLQGRENWYIPFIVMEQIRPTKHNDNYKNSKQGITTIQRTFVKVKNQNENSKQYIPVLLQNRSRFMK